MFFKPEAMPAELPHLVKQCIQITGWKPWEARLRSLDQQVRTNPFIEEYFADRYGLEIEMGKTCRRLRLGQKLRLPETYDQTALYSFVAMVARVHQRLSPAGRTRLAGMIRDGLQAEYGLASLEQEMGMAAHLMARGFHVMFHDIEHGGGFDILAKRDELELEVEVKTLSGDVGRNIHRRRVYQLGAHLLPAMERALQERMGGQLLRVTLPKRLFGTDEYMRAVSAQISSALSSGNSAQGPDPCAIEYITFPLDGTPFVTAPPAREAPRNFVEQLIGVENVNVIMLVNPPRSAVVVTVESAQKDAMMDAMVRDLKKTAKRQLTKTRPGVICVRFSDVTQKELLHLAYEDKSGKTSALQMATSCLLERDDWRHVHTIAYLSPGEVMASRYTFGQTLTRHVRETGQPYAFKNPYHELADEPRAAVF